MHFPLLLFRCLQLNPDTYIRLAPLFRTIVSPDVATRHLPIIIEMKEDARILIQRSSDPLANSLEPRRPLGIYVFYVYMCHLPP